jgi:enolase-phosphatase E1
LSSIAGLLTDIEGTTTPIAFVKDRLFPFARARLRDFVATRGHEPEVAAELAETRRLAPGEDPVDVLERWIDEDRKATPLKTLQGMIWDEGYAAGALRGELYPDVAPALRSWRASGLTLAVYSSGSVAAQKLIFGHSTDGDLAGLFRAFFDTRVGAKREPDSYDRIAIGLGLAASELLFLSDVEAELDAARSAGLLTCQLVRAADNTVASIEHPTARDFADVAQRFGFAAGH